MGYINCPQVWYSATCWSDGAEHSVKACNEGSSQLSQNRRSPAEKYGRYRWIEMLQRRILERVERMEKRQRLILKGLQHYFVFPEDYVLNVIAETPLDHAILQVLREAGAKGVLPSKIAYQLRTYGVNRFKVTRRIKAMNRRLQTELGYHAAEKVGHKWVLTDFVLDIWGASKEEMKKSITPTKVPFQQAKVF